VGIVEMRIPATIGRGGFGIRDSGFPIQEVRLEDGGWKMTRRALRARSVFRRFLLFFGNSQRLDSAPPAGAGARQRSPGGSGDSYGGDDFYGSIPEGLHRNHLPFLKRMISMADYSSTVARSRTGFQPVRPA